MYINVSAIVISLKIPVLYELKHLDTTASSNLPFIAPSYIDEENPFINIDYYDYYDYAEPGNTVDQTDLYSNRKMLILFYYFGAFLQSS